MTLLFLMGCGESLGNVKQDALIEGFASPPNEALPTVMWWWLNSSISEKGITNDLEEMANQGIGGALIFDAAPEVRWKPDPGRLSVTWLCRYPLAQHLLQSTGRAVAKDQVIDENADSRRHRRIGDADPANTSSRGYFRYPAAQHRATKLSQQCRKALIINKV